MEAIGDIRGAACKNSATRWTAPIRSLGFTKGSYHLQKVDERHEEGPDWLPGVWGSKTPITIVTCGFARAGRQSDRCESPSLKARVRLRVHLVRSAA